MGRVTYTPLEEGLAAAADANAILSAIEAQSTNLEPVNFQEDGVDERSFADNVAHQQAFSPKTLASGTGTQALTTAWVTLSPSHGASFRTGAISLAANEIMRVVLRLEFESDAVQDGIPVSAGVSGDVELRWQQSVGAALSNPGTVRRVKVGTASAPIAITGAPARVSHQLVLQGPLALDWIEPQIRTAAAAGITAQMGGGTMAGVIYKRVTV